ncbi:Integrase [Caballeronia sordidicola]|uniref:Integrase n=1 Tax=Caballeronia sordidicola TaxID=196367 RepID=A0A242MFE2_CABSO|nr:Integrase [Caballeronia sordidicola]
MVIEVMTSGSKVWRYRYTLNGERRPLVTIGDYPAVTLQAARERARKYNALVQSGISPAESAKKDRGAAKVENTMRSVFEAWMIDQVAQRSTDKHQTEIRRSFEKDVLRTLGKKAPSEVSVTDVRKITDSIKARGSVQAALQLRNRLKRFFNYAVAAGHVEMNPAQAAEVHFIASQSSRTRVLTPDEIGEVMRSVYKANMRRAMKLAVHLLMITLVRKTELTEARWTEFDLDAAIWRIPAERMKKDKEHWVYLPSQAVEMFRELQEMTTGDFVFPTTRAELTQPIDPSTLNDAVKALQMDMPRFVLHDFRRTASTHLHDMGHSSDAIEKCLAHSIRGMRGVYNRAEYADERRKILQVWADFVDAQIMRKGSVVIGNFARSA